MSMLSLKKYKLFRSKSYCKEYIHEKCKNYYMDNYYFIGLTVE